MADPQNANPTILNPLIYLREGDEHLLISPNQIT